MKTRDLRELSDEELAQQVRDGQRQLVELRLKCSVGESDESPLRLRFLRRDIARMKTIMTEREASAS